MNKCKIVRDKKEYKLVKENGEVLGSYSKKGFVGLSGKESQITLRNSTYSVNFQDSAFTKKDAIIPFSPVMGHVYKKLINNSNSLEYGDSTTEKHDSLGHRLTLAEFNKPSGDKYTFTEILSPDSDGWADQNNNKVAEVKTVKGFFVTNEAVIETSLDLDDEENQAFMFWVFILTVPNLKATTITTVLILLLFLLAPILHFFFDVPIRIPVR
jgi:hypothetical protein